MRDWHLRALRTACTLLPRKIREDQFSEWRDEIQCAQENGLSARRRTLSIVLRSIPRLAWRARQPSRIRTGSLAIAEGLGKKLPKSFQEHWALTRFSWTKMLVVTLAVVLFDLGSKAWVSTSVGLYEIQHPLPNLAIFPVKNPGLNYSLLYGGAHIPTYILAGLATLMALNLTFGTTLSRLWLIMGLFLGGVAGNLAEYLYHGYVTDFIFLQGNAWQGIFNFADLAIVLSAVVCITPDPRGARVHIGQGCKSDVTGNSIS